MKKALLALVTLLAITSAAQTALAAYADITLDNGYLRMGLDHSGGLINWSQYYAGNYYSGIGYDPTGKGNFNTHDFVTPGSPFEFYSLGIGGAYVTANAGWAYNPLEATSTKLGDASGVTTNGLWNGLRLTQSLYFDPDRPNVAVFDITLKNTTQKDMNNVVYARGLDPDQDYFGFWDYSTINRKVSNDLVTATGPQSKLNLSLFTESAYEHFSSVSNWWETNPYTLLTGMNDGNGDNTIALAFNIGTLKAGKTATFEYELSVSKTPIPGAVWLLGSGLFGLVGLRRRFCA